MVLWWCGWRYGAGGGVVLGVGVVGVGVMVSVLVLLVLVAIVVMGMRGGVYSIGEICSISCMAVVV